MFPVGMDGPQAIPQAGPGCSSSVSVCGSRGVQGPPLPGRGARAGWAPPAWRVHPIDTQDGRGWLARDESRFPVFCRNNFTLCAAAEQLHHGPLSAGPVIAPFCHLQVLPFVEERMHDARGHVCGNHPSAKAAAQSPFESARPCRCGEHTPAASRVHLPTFPARPLHAGRDLSSESPGASPQPGHVRAQ